MARRFGERAQPGWLGRDPPSAVVLLRRIRHGEQSPSQTPTACIVCGRWYPAPRHRRLLPRRRTTPIAWRRAPSLLLDGRDDTSPAMTCDASSGETAGPWADDVELTLIAAEILAEARRLRELQEGRVDEVRRRSMTLVSLMTPAVIVVAGVADDPNRPLLALGVSALVLALACTALVQFAKGTYQEGPNILELTAVQYGERHPRHQLLRDLATYHFEIYRSNNGGTLADLHKWFDLQIASCAFAAVLTIAAVVVG